MNERRYDQFFIDATSHKEPFGYQCRLVCGDHACLGNPESLAGGRKCDSLLINVPTGLGKTAAVVLAWLWNRVYLESPEWPRRLVYCLPMRTLVEQTRDQVTQWLKNLAGEYPENHELKWLLEHSPVVLMGGDERDQKKSEWDIYPERPAILIGTQDMLLSRALNRGYAMSRYRWPMHFGLLNNDCLWVMDEVQLMGNGLATSIQLDGFRSGLWGTSGLCISWWMSATASADVFGTTDREELSIAAPSLHGLIESDHRDERLNLLLNAEKRLEWLAKAPKLTSRELTGVLDLHQSGRLTLVVTNTVSSALEWHANIKSELDKGPPGKRRGNNSAPEVILLHSRFRPIDRYRNVQRLQRFLKLTSRTGMAEPGHPGLIVVATQVVEAGMDLSSAVLWSEVAPWTSVIQRLGRLNRDGKQPNAVARFWMPKPKDEENGKGSPNAGRSGPYEKVALRRAAELVDAILTKQKLGQPYRVALDGLIVSEASLQALTVPNSVVMRADDLYGLFSTEPDLAGGFTNVAPFVRTADLSVDTTVYWREFKDRPPADTDESVAEEIVHVPSHLLSRFLEKAKSPAFLWDEDAERWQPIRAREVVPGMDLLLPVSAGGYSEERGWTGNSGDKLAVSVVQRSHRSSLFTEWESKIGWQTLSQHTAMVEAAVARIGEAINLSPEKKTALSIAAKWHDVGKAHRRWQEPLLPHAPEGKCGPWGKFKNGFAFRPGVRHEAFSLLAAWQQWEGREDNFTALALYLIASHHGRVRTVLRSTGKGRNLFGWLAQDESLSIEGYPPCVPDLSVKNFAGNGLVDWTSKCYTAIRPSWNAVIDELLGPCWRGDPALQLAVPNTEPRQLGPFELAYIEAAFRAADARASGGIP